MTVGKEYPRAPAPGDGLKTGAIRPVFLRTPYEALFGYFYPAFSIRVPFFPSPVPKCPNRFVMRHFQKPAISAFLVCALTVPVGSRVSTLRHNRCEPFLFTASTSMPAGETVVGAHPAKFSQAGGPTVPKSLKSSAHRNRSLRSVRAHGHPIAFLSHRPPCAHIVKVRFCPVCVSCEHLMSEHLGFADPAEAELLSHLYNGCLDCARCADES